MELLHKCVRFAITTIICISLLWAIKFLGLLIGLEKELVSEIRWGVVAIWMWLVRQWTNRAGKNLMREKRRKPKCL